MKKVLLIVFCVIFSLSITACSNDKIESANKIVDDYFMLIQEGNYTDAMYLCLDDVDDKFGLNDLIEVIDDDLVNDNSDTFTKEAGQWITYTVSKTIKDYEIIDSIENKGTYEVYVRGKTLDFKNFNLLLEDDLDKKMNQYIKENTSEFQKIISSNTEDEAMNKINTELSKYIFDEMKNIVDKTGYIDFAMKFTLKDVKGQKKIVNIDDSVLSNQ